jgi:hypothetical protein
MNGDLLGVRPSCVNVAVELARSPRKARGTPIASLGFAMKTIARWMLVLSAALPLAGCYVYADPEPATVEAGYEPMYYDGNVVYYDEVGAPFVWAEGRIVYVPRTYGHYDVLVNHYHRHYRGYRNWYRAHPYARHYHHRR